MSAAPLCLSAGRYPPHRIWTSKYPQIAAAVSSLRARQAYLDGELCGVGPDGITSFSMIQAASDAGNAAGLVFFLFDLLYLDGEDLSARPLLEREISTTGHARERHPRGGESKAEFDVPISPISPQLSWTPVEVVEGPADASFFTLSKRKGLPHLSGSRPRDRRFHVEGKTKERQHLTNSNLSVK